MSQFIFGPATGQIKEMEGATSSAAGAAGLVPAPQVGDEDKYLKGDGTFGTVDLSEKADKVASATNGNFAALDSNGNLTDSGHKHSDYLQSSLKGANSGLAELDSSGKVPSSQLPTELPTVSSADNGKFLQVVNGVWAAVTVPNANGVSF